MPSGSAVYLVEDSTFNAKDYKLITCISNLVRFYVVLEKFLIVEIFFSNNKQYVILSKPIVH